MRFQAQRSSSISQADKGADLAGSPGNQAFSAAPTPLRSRSSLGGSRARASSVSVPGCVQPTGGDAAGAFDEQACRVCFGVIDADGNGSVSKLELVDAVYRDRKIWNFVFQGLQDDDTAPSPMSDEQSFDAVDAIFGAMSGGRPRVAFAEFAAYFRQRAAAQGARGTPELQAIFRRLDADGNGSVSKLELLAAVQKDRLVASFMFPGLDGSRVMGDERSFDSVSAAFDTIAGGKRRIEYVDFDRYFRKSESPVWSLGAPQDAAAARRQRAGKRILVIGLGFGLDHNLQQGTVLGQAGFEVHWCQDLPEPNQFAFPSVVQMEKLRAAIARVQPEVLVAASMGGAYMVGAWVFGLWKGPSLMINAHPSLTQLPLNVPMVLAHGANDEVFPRHRPELENLIATGGSRCFLYYSGNSGQIAPGAFTRIGDQHQMQSLTVHDCLPSLVDGLLSTEGPEAHMIRSWRHRRSQERLEAENWLGYTTERLRCCWVSPGRKGADRQKLFEVHRGSEEFSKVAAIFKASPAEPSDYELPPQAAWDRTGILKIERVENGQQEAGSARPYCEAIRKALRAQGLTFEPGVHTCWAFHGTGPDPNTVESIISDPVAGFQPLTCGSHNKSLWGPGAYFARDAQYVAEGNFCTAVSATGGRRMLLCLLTLGIPCVGDATHTGVLPYRQKPHRYNSSVDSLSSPEIYAVQHPGAAYPAYVITFV